MTKVSSFVKMILNTGIEGGTAPFDKRRIQLINFIVLISITVGTISEIFALYSLGFVWEGFLMYLSPMILLVAILYLNSIKKYDFGRIAIAVLANVTLFILMAYWDSNLRASQFYFVNFVIYLAIFEKYKSIIFWSIVTFGIFVIGTYLQVYHIFTPVFAPESKMIPFFRFMFIIITSIFLFLFTLFFKKGNDDYQKTLNHTNEKLQSALKTINERNLKLQENISEKEVLIQEINHRVKNNLQVISSLFDLQLDKNLNDKSHKILQECKNRVNAISLVHEKLYLSTNFEQIDLKGYVSDLILNISQSHVTTKVSTKLFISNFRLNMDNTIYIGLIINELVTNCYKYAFEGNKGKLMISLQKKEGIISLVVQDNGSGLPNDFNFESSTESELGINLVRMLTRQLKGESQFESDKGLKVTINFAA